MQQPSIDLSPWSPSEGTDSPIFIPRTPPTKTSSIKLLPAFKSTIRKNGHSSSYCDQATELPRWCKEKGHSGSSSSEYTALSTPSSSTSGRKSRLGKHRDYIPSRSTSSSLSVSNVSENSDVSDVERARRGKRKQPPSRSITEDSKLYMYY